MATIITVHGTGATGSEEGERWWQKDSEFENHIRELVNSEDGELNWQPHVWDGANSETSRRKAGTDLFKSISKLENVNSDYCVVGHSHGGSVISHSLLYSSKYNKPLENLKLWITVGTPFILLKKHNLFFNRIDTLGKSIYAAILTALILSLTYFYIYQFIDYNRPDSSATASIIDLATSLFVVIMIIFTYCFSYYINSKKHYYYNKGILTFCEKHFSNRYVSMSHKNDEAVQSLIHLKQIKPRIFRSNFAVPVISFASVFILPIILLVSLSDEKIVLWLLEKTYGTDPWVAAKATNSNLIEKYGMSLDAVNYFISGNYYMYLFGNFEEYDFIYAFKIVVELLIVIVTAIFATIIYFLAFFTSKIVSNLLSKGLNILTWSQVRRTGLGDDIGSETSYDAQSAPYWTTCKPFPPLPDELGNEISAHSDAAASKAVSKFRAGISQFTFSEGETETSNMFSEYLTWDELIHTSYFSIPRFRKLVAYAITQADGFGASEQFKSDPDYSTVARWYEELKPQPVEAA